MNRKKALENIFSKILGSTVNLEETTDLEEKKLKKQFTSFVELYEKVWDRQENLMENFNTNLSSYDDMFFQVIERLIFLCFDPIFAEAITFFVYNRKMGDEILPFIDENGESHLFKTTDDLWDFFNDAE